MPFEFDVQKYLYDTNIYNTYKPCRYSSVTTDIYTFAST